MSWPRNNDHWVTDQWVHQPRENGRFSPRRFQEMGSTKRPLGRHHSCQFLRISTKLCGQPAAKCEKSKCCTRDAVCPDHQCGADIVRTLMQPYVQRGATPDFKIWVKYVADPIVTTGYEVAEPLTLFGTREWHPHGRRIKQLAPSVEE